MRVDLAPVAVAALSLGVGIPVLLALRFVDRSARSILAGAGLAYLTGFAAIGLVALELLVIGVPVTLPVVVAVAVVLALVAVWRRPRAPLRPPATGDEPPPLSAARAIRPRSLLDKAALAIFGLLYAAIGAGGLLGAAATPLEHWDSWAIWTRKAVVLASWNSLPAGIFESASSGMPHPDYPLLMPLFEALHFRLAGGLATQAVGLDLWVILIAFGGAMAFLGSRLVRPAIWVPVVLCAMFAPGVYGQLLTGYADVPMGAFLGAGTVLIGVWLARGGSADLALGTVMLAAAASTKNEGLTAAISVLAAAGAVTVARRALPRLRTFALAAGGFAVVILPWRLWLAAHHISGDLPIGKGLQPSFLDTRSWRVDPAVSALTRQLGDQHTLLLLVPVAIVLCLAGMMRRRLQSIAGFYLASGLVTFALLVWAYWISPHRLRWHLATSANRVVIGIVMLAVAAILQLAGALDGDAKAEETGVRHR